jgi:acetylglutamate kinase
MEIHIIFLTNQSIIWVLLKQIHRRKIWLLYIQTFVMNTVLTVKGIGTNLIEIINATKPKKVQEKNIRLLIADKTIPVIPPILVDIYAADWKG